MKLGLEMETGWGEEICFKVSSAERLIQTLRFKVFNKVAKQRCSYLPAFWSTRKPPKYSFFYDYKLKCVLKLIFAMTKFKAIIGWAKEKSTKDLLIIIINNN